MSKPIALKRHSLSRWSQKARRVTRRSSGCGCWLSNAWPKGKWCVWRFLRWLSPIRGSHSQGSGKTILISTLCWSTLLRHAAVWIRRSPRHEPLGPGYRHADLLAPWPGNRCGSGRHHPPQQLAATIITIEEVLGGWYTQVRRARDDQQLARAYEALQQTVEFTRGIQLLPFDLPGIRRYRQLRTHHRRIGTNDLRIAAIVLEQ